MKKKIFRCAIYTRKSTEEGLDQAFNTLHAQREACDAYVQSQIHEGWQVILTLYDDGGFSGGNMERPALKRLLNDIEDNKVDIVVVYKIDRLTRALADFAKMVEIFDNAEHPVSFVSVTQQFNTTTSMGRLTLNVLLSFAQFEREVIGERVRDKIAASKKKGMWMGGTLPIGYDVKDRQLIINEKEAAHVQIIFDKYLELQSVHEVKNYLDDTNIVSKKHISKAGKESGGRPLVRGALYTILRNPIYIGRIRHKDKTYQGTHEPIIKIEIWDKVQALLSSNSIERSKAKTIQAQSLLVGIIYDQDLNRMTPSHAVKSDGKGSKKRYRYYVSSNKNSSSKLRLPATDLEQSIISTVSNHLEKEDQLNGLLSKHLKTAHEFNLVKENGPILLKKLNTSSSSEKAYLLQHILKSIMISPEEINIHLSLSGLANYLLKRNDIQYEQVHTLKAPFEFKRCGVEMKMILGNIEQPTSINSPLIKALIKGQQLLDRLVSTDNITIAELAKTEEIATSYLTRLLQMPLLSPKIQEAILNGNQPADLTANKIMYLPTLPNDWNEQEKLLGF